MKKIFFDFQVSKEAMNELRGGVIRCHCETGGESFLMNDENFDTLDSIMQQICGDNIGWACSKVPVE